MTRVIEPTEGRILVQLNASKYGDVPVPEKTYDTVNEGVVIAINPNDKEWYSWMVGRTAHFRDYKDELRVATTADGKKLAIILISDVDGTSYEE